MVSETVILDTQNTPMIITRSDLVRSWVKVNPSFTMHNDGMADENIQAQFPLSNWDGSGDGSFEFPEIEKLVVEVDGKRTPTIRRLEPLTADTEVAWAVFDVTFSANKDVVINVTYTDRATGYPLDAEFYYILQIGEAGQAGMDQLALLTSFCACHMNPMP